MTNANAPHTQPSNVIAEEGEVNMDGPDGLAISFAPDAAEETGRRLVDAASDARHQVQGSSA